MAQAWFQETHPDPSITFQSELEYPIATMTRNTIERLQIIPVNGVWQPVVLERGAYRAARSNEVGAEVWAVIEWAYTESLPPADAPPELALERDIGGETQNA